MTVHAGDDAELSAHHRQLDARALPVEIVFLNKYDHNETADVQAFERAPGVLPKEALRLPQPGPHQDQEEEERNA